MMDSDRRHCPRYAVGSAQATCKRLPLACLRPNMAQQLVDLSASGAKVILSGPVAKGDWVHMRINFPGCAEEIESNARVVWASRAGSPSRRDSTTVAGLSFTLSPPLIERKLERIRSPRGRIVRRG